eukprot:4509766-Karenia_brevis.AAC.1
MMATGLRLMHEMRAVKLVVDATYKTNEQKLVVVAVGPVFLHSENDKVTNRFMPLVCVLANRENEDAYKAALDFLLDYSRAKLGKDLAAEVEDVYVDGSGGAHNPIANTLPNARVHRDLQHIKA